MIAAIYARYSSDNQSDKSIDDQIRSCREFAQRQGIEINDQNLFTDYAVSGTSDNRPGLKALLAACEAGKVQAVIIDDSSRLSRHNLHFLQYLATFEVHGISLISVADGLDSADENSKIAFGFRGVMNQMYVDDLRKKTKRGQVGQFHRGYMPSSLGYGYQLKKHGERRPDNKGRVKADGSRPEIIETEATNIRRIFSDYGNGKSLNRIALELNQENVPCRKGKWNTSTISKILRNKNYIGKYTYNKTKTVKDPITGKRRSKPNDEENILRRDDPEMRIVTDEMWEKVKARLSQKENMHPTSKGKKGFPGKQTSYVKSHPPTLLAGSLKCGCCGGPIVQVGGKNGGYYGCQNKKYGTCSNSQTIHREKVEDHLINALFEKVLFPEYLDSIYEKAFEVIKHEFAHIPEEIGKKKAELQKSEKSISNLVRFISDGGSESVRKALEETESKVRSLKVDIEYLNKALADNVVRPSQEFVASHVAELKSLLELRTEKSALILRSILGEEIILTPEEGEDGKKFYKATTKIGTLSLLGSSEKSSNSLLWWRWGESNPRP